MDTTTLPIGVFDSGMGGLTVLRAVQDTLPYESFIYLGDTARLPYGTKSTNTVQQYAMQMARILVERRIKALVIACNTATTAALSHLQAMLPTMPVLGVVAPGALAASLATRNARIAVLATETTIASQAYQKLILHHLPKATISTQVCSLLVALAEEGMASHDIAEATLKHYLTPFDEEDTLLLGCTHFPVFKPLLRTILPPHVTLVDSAQATAVALQQVLADAGILNQEARSSYVHYLVTDSVKRFQEVGEVFLQRPLSDAHVELVDPI